MGECRKMSDQCGDFDDINSVRDEPLEVYDIAGGDGLTGAKGRGSDHAIGMRSPFASGFVKKARSELRLVFGEGVDAAAEKVRETFVRLLVGAWAN
jgi:hypothetical protein